jgi:hypothetical protein
MPKLSDAAKTILKFLGVACAAMAGALQDAQPLYAGLLGAGALLCTGLTVAGLTQADVVKLALKVSGLTAASIAGYLQPTQPQMATMLAALGTAFTAFTVPAPGTDARVAAAAVPTASGPGGASQL